MFLSSFALAGLFVTHYRVLFFALTFLAIYTLYGLWQQRADTLRNLRPFLRRWLGLAGAALLLAMPWLVQVIDTAVLPVDTFCTRIARHAGGQNEAPLGYVLLGIDRWIVALALGGALWSLRRRIAALGLLLLWMVALFVSADPSVLGYRGRGS